MKKATAIILCIVLALALVVNATAFSTIAVKSIKLNNSKVTLNVGQSSDITVAFTPANTSQTLLTYVTSNKKVATVSSTGKITGVAKGTATITVLTQNKKVYAKCNVTVSLQDWQIDKKPITVEWYIGESWAGTQPDYVNKLVDKTILAQTGIKIHITVPSDSKQDKLNAMIAAGNLPDVVTMSWTYPQVKMMEDGGLVVPLLDLASKYAPNFKKEIPKSMIDCWTYKGKWYGLASSFMAPEDTAKSTKNYLTQNAGFLARKDIMDKLGIKPGDFKTQDGTIAALKKVQAAGLKENGVPIAPLVTDMQRSTVSDLAEFFGDAPELANGNLAPAEKSPKLKEAYQFMNKLNRAGLISKDNFTTWQKNEIEGMIKSGTIFMFMTNWGGKNNWGAAFSNNPSYEYIPVGPVLSKDGGRPYLNVSGMPGWTLSMITKSSKYQARLIRFFEYLYNDQTQMLTNYGIEGQTYDMVDGHVKFKPDVQKDMDAGNGWTKYGFYGWWYAGNNFPVYEHAPVDNSPTTQYYNNIWNYFNQKGFTFDGTVFRNLDPDPGTEAADVAASVNTYLDSQYIKLITANTDAEFNTAYSDMTAKLDSLGYDKLLAARNEKFQENKAKFGLKRAFPKQVKK